MLPLPGARLRLAEAIDMMVDDEIKAKAWASNPAMGWERAFANIAAEVVERERARIGKADPRRCDCGATPDPSESPDTGNYVENGVAKYICLRCWQIENEGEGARPS